MTGLFKLDPRLETIAGFIKKGSRVLDIGTDHAYLPVWLSRTGRCAYVLATDINEKPLMSAQRSVERYAAQNIELKCTDGLKDIDISSFDYIVIAGMGGELIAEILSGLSGKFSPKQELLLCPTTKSEILRDFLYKKGFFVENEPCIISKKHVYSVMRVLYSGESRPLTEFERYTGKTSEIINGASLRYLEYRFSYVQKKIKGLKNPDDLKKLSDVNIQIQKLTGKEFVL